MLLKENKIMIGEMDAISSFPLFAEFYT